VGSRSLDGLARQREVVLLDNRGVGASTGVVPDNVEDMARDVLRFVDALGLTEIDVLGFSLGGFVAQTLALTRPRLIRSSPRSPAGGSRSRRSSLGSEGSLSRRWSRTGTTTRR